MKTKTLNKAIFLVFGLVCLTSSAYAAKPTVIIQFNDPASLCTSGNSGEGIYLDYSYTAAASTDPKQTMNLSGNTSWLKSGDSYGVTIPSYPPYTIYDIMIAFYVTNIGNSCGNLGWVKGGSCDNNQLMTPIKGSTTVVVQATPAKVPLTFGGYGYQLNCTVTQYSAK